MRVDGEFIAADILRRLEEGDDGMKDDTVMIQFIRDQLQTVFCRVAEIRDCLTVEILLPLDRRLERQAKTNQRHQTDQQKLAVKFLIKRQVPSQKPGPWEYTQPPVSFYSLKKSLIIWCFLLYYGIYTVPFANPGNLWYLNPLLRNKRLRIQT
jgi:hypothetical protein